jgi:hypothetical protein
MKQQLRIGTNTINLKGQAFGTAYLLVQGVGAAALTNADFALANLRIRIDLKQANLKDSTSFNAVAPTFRGACEYQHPSMLTDLGFSANGQTLRGKLLTGSTTQSAFTVPLLSGGYILSDEDCISFVIEVLPSFFTANSSNASSVNLVIESDNDIQQVDVNLPVYEPITTDRQSPAYSYDSVSQVVLINTNTAYTFANDPFNSIEVRSKHVSDTFDIFTLFDKRTYKSTQQLANGTTHIYDFEPSTIDNVQINLNVVTANVISGSQFLYVSKTLMSTTLAVKSLLQSDKIASRKLSARGVTNKVINALSRNF